MLTRDQILALDDMTREAVEIPEWKGSIFVRVLTGQERDWLDAQSLSDAGEALPLEERLRNYRGRIVAMSACNADGSSLFTLQDAEALGRKSAKALDRIVTASQRLNAMTDAEVEVLEKNSDPIQGSDSGSS